MNCDVFFHILPMQIESDYNATFGYTSFRRSKMHLSHPPQPYLLGLIIPYQNLLPKRQQDLVLSLWDCGPVPVLSLWDCGPQWESIGFLTLPPCMSHGVWSTTNQYTECIMLNKTPKIVGIFKYIPWISWVHMEM